MHKSLPDIKSWREQTERLLSGIPESPSQGTFIEVLSKDRTIRRDLHKAVVRKLAEAVFADDIENMFADDIENMFDPNWDCGDQD